MSTTGIAETTQYLTFKLEEEVFAVDVAKVREVLDFTLSTKIPGTPDFMRGVINVRENIIPVVDIRLKFGLSINEKTVDTCIVVMEISVEDEKTILGILVDSVQEVFELEANRITPPPRIGSKWRTEFVKGIGKRNDDLIIILDIDQVFSNMELGMIQETGMRKP